MSPLPPASVSASRSPAAFRLGSSLRCRPPAETLALGTGLMRSLGISRVTDLTRMDRLGLPVFASIRPRGRALCVHAGKGVHAVEARVGALMEAIEYAAAEPQRSALPRRAMRIDELEDSWSDRLTLLDLAPRIGLDIPSERLADVVLCDEAGGGRPAWLPAELVFVPFEDPHGEALFGWSTNGLASGNSSDEATLHGLLEVLERDAVAMDLSDDASCWVDPGDLPEPFRTLAAKWRRIGIALAVRYVPNEFALPCFTALVHEGGGASVDMAAGSGLHLDPGIALARAVCEAAQSRLGHIHGGRDDVTRFFSKHDESPRSPRDARDNPVFQEAFDTRRRIAWSELPSMPHEDETIEAVLGRLTGHLAALGFPHVFRHRFEADLGGLHVVKVVVPRCQELGTELDRLGPRMLQQIEAHA